MLVEIGNYMTNHIINEISQTNVIKDQVASNIHAGECFEIQFY